MQWSARDGAGAGLSQVQNGSGATHSLEAVTAEQTQATIGQAAARTRPNRLSSSPTWPQAFRVNASSRPSPAGVRLGSRRACGPALTRISTWGGFLRPTLARPGIFRSYGRRGPALIAADRGPRQAVRPLSSVPVVHIYDSRYRGASIPNCSPARPARMPWSYFSRHAAESVAIGFVASSFPASVYRTTLS